MQTRQDYACLCHACRARLYQTSPGRDSTHESSPSKRAISSLCVYISHQRTEMAGELFQETWRHTVQPLHTYIKSRAAKCASRSLTPLRSVPLQTHGLNAHLTHHHCVKLVSFPLGSHCIYSCGSKNRYHRPLRPSPPTRREAVRALYRSRTRVDNEQRTGTIRRSRCVVFFQGRTMGARVGGVSNIYNKRIGIPI